MFLRQWMLGGFTCIQSFVKGTVQHVKSLLQSRMRRLEIASLCVQYTCTTLQKGRLVSLKRHCVIVLMRLFWKCSLFYLKCLHRSFRTKEKSSASLTWTELSVRCLFNNLFGWTVWLHRLRCLLSVQTKQIKWDAISVNVGGNCLIWIQCRVNVFFLLTSVCRDRRLLFCYWRQTQINCF